MAFGTVGLSTHIWNNNLKSMMILSFYPFLMLGLVWLISFALGWVLFGSQHMAMDSDKSFSIALNFANVTMADLWIIVLGVVGAWFTISWFFHAKMISKLSQSHSVTRSEEPELYNLLENLCISRGIPMPSLEIIESHALNAFASGITDSSYKITMTRGLLQSLSKDEVEAVLAHELTHILNRDVRLLIICIIFTGMLGFAVQLIWIGIRSSMYSRGKKDGRILIAALIVLAILGIGYLTTIFSRFALSRKREYMADAGAVELTRNPEAMMRALQRISGNSVMKKTSSDVAMMCIENPVPFMGLFMTHPPIERRIDTLSQLSGAAVPEPSENFEPFYKNEDKTKWIDRSEDTHYDRKSKNPWLRKRD